jgi:hypothetical protein
MLSHTGLCHSVATVKEFIIAICISAQGLMELVSVLTHQPNYKNKKTEALIWDSNLQAQHSLRPSKNYPHKQCKLAGSSSL